MHTNRFTTQAFQARVLDHLDLSQALAASSQQSRAEPGSMATPIKFSPGQTTLQLASKEKLPVLIAKQLLVEIEQGGSIVRDQQVDSAQSWHRNHFRSAAWDGQPA